MICRKSLKVAFDTDLQCIKPIIMSKPTSSAWAGRLTFPLFLLLAFCLTDFLHPTVLPAGNAREIYLSAENCQKELRHDVVRQKYRQFWLECIERYMDVYRLDPRGSWASAGLYQAGLLYLELHRISYKESDRQTAIETFEKILAGYPKSRYRSLAAEKLSALADPKDPPEKTKSAGAIQPSRPDSGAEKQFARAQDIYQQLIDRPESQTRRDKWLIAIEAFQKAYQLDPQGPKAAEALYQTGWLYSELYRKSQRGSDHANAKAAFMDVMSRYPDDPFAGKAQAALEPAEVSGKNEPLRQGELSPEEQKRAALDRIARMIAEAEQENVKQKDPSPASQGPVTVNGLRFWSNPNYTRIVIDADGEVPFSHRLLKKSSTGQPPQRLSIDLAQSRLGGDMKRHIPINDNLLIDTRASQYSADSVRVVVDIKSYKTYKIFSLKNPFRVVLDVWGVENEEKSAAAGKSGSGKNGSKTINGALAKQLALGVRRVVIDPGHGGHDYGAPGYIKGVYEKDVVLKISKKLAVKIKHDLNCETVLTRGDDRYLTLEERTAFANTKNADLFISIHTNAARDRRAFGLETYYLNLATDDEAILVAARENATSMKNISDLESILNDLMQNAKINESIRLAGYVQQSLFLQMQRNFDSIKSKGVKQAPFYVLLGAQMPAILVETSFISNARECKRLIDPRYQEQICEGIVRGIQKYIQELNPTARFQTPEKKAVEG
jgi:N-acetylmuramoyl-L-alanine amidase